MKIGFIGCGNMGGALARAAAKSGNKIFLSDLNSEKTSALAKEISAKINDNFFIAENCDYIFLGVKPQMMEKTLTEIKEDFKNRKSRFVLISMAAGQKIEKIRNLSGGDYPVIRIMPNTPASIGEGMILYTSNGVEPKEIEEFLCFMKESGRLDLIDEELIDAASAVSGCGPAFVCQFAMALAEGGKNCGLTYEKALLYAAATISGTAELILQSGIDPEILKQNVCSPGGSTIEGVKVLDNSNFNNDIEDAIMASYKRTKELGK